jgi:hypothetical protein
MSSKSYYDPAKYPVGSLVRIADSERLREFAATWKYHHKLAENQIEFGGRIAKVLMASMYHGGDDIYKLEDIPGLWHEQLLDPA